MSIKDEFFSQKQSYKELTDRKRFDTLILISIRNEGIQYENSNDRNRRNNWQ